MEKTFKGMFKTVRYKNKTLKKMATILKEMKSVSTKDSCLICYFSSHGDNEGVATWDGKTLRYDDIYDALGNNVLLQMNGKPKLVILDCCLGKKTHTFEPRVLPKGNPGEIPIYSEKIHSGLAILKSAADGYKSYALENQPSFFTSAFCEAFENCKTHDYTDIVHETTSIIEKNNYPKQCVPKSESFLAARLIFETSS